MIPLGLWILFSVLFEWYWLCDTWTLLRWKKSMTCIVAFWKAMTMEFTKNMNVRGRADGRRLNHWTRLVCLSVKKDSSPLWMSKSSFFYDQPTTIFIPISTIFWVECSHKTWNFPSIKKQENLSIFHCVSYCWSSAKFSQKMLLECVSSFMVKTLVCQNQG